MITEFRDSYAGPWPTAALHLLLVAIGGPLIGMLLTDEPLSLRLFMGSCLVAIAAFSIGVWAKRRYPRSDGRG